MRENLENNLKIIRVGIPSLRKRMVKVKKIITFFISCIICIFFFKDKEGVDVESQKTAVRAIPIENTHRSGKEIQEEVEKSLAPTEEALFPILPEAAEPYTELLINYARVLHDPSYNQGDGTGWGIDENMVYDRVLRHVGKEPNEVVYAIVDLAGRIRAKG